MPTYSEKKTLPYTTDQMFDLVIDIEKYPDFLPWCIDCKILKKKDDVIFANLVIGYKLFHEWFQSKVFVLEDKSIEVEYINGPLKYLRNTWKFIPHIDGSSTVDFHVDFEFKNPMFERLVGMLFHEIAKRMVGAFVIRAEELYGPVEPNEWSDTSVEAEHDI